jgi:DNA-binding GntR family transcriptional regulator
MELPKLHRERTVDAVYAVLRDSILAHRIAPGERLHVDELAQKLGVSLTPVRQAIQQLATEGLVEVKPRSGTFVANLTPKDVAETFKIRRALECLAAEGAIENAGENELRQLRELLQKLSKPVRTDRDRRAHEQHNEEFHKLLVRLGGNQRLCEIYESLNAHLKIARAHRNEADWPARLREEQSEHEAIFKALKSRDLETLRRSLTDHIERAEQNLLAAVGATPQGVSPQ